jgi:hypothetical protein
MTDYDEWKTTDPADRDEDFRNEETTPRWIVRRFLGPTLVKAYGPTDRETAEWIAQRSAEKHPRCILKVEVYRGWR